MCWLVEHSVHMGNAGFKIAFVQSEEVIPEKQSVCKRTVEEEKKRRKKKEEEVQKYYYFPLMDKENEHGRR